jgi:hypothetical protein
VVVVVVVVVTTSVTCSASPGLPTLVLSSVAVVTVVLLDVSVVSYKEKNTSELVTNMNIQPEHISSSEFLLE